MPNLIKAPYVLKERRVKLKKYKILNGDPRKKLKNSKLKKKLKTQEFGIFTTPTCRKYGQKTSLL